MDGAENFPAFQSVNFLLTSTLIEVNMTEDYGITHVRMNLLRTRIEWVRALPRNGEQFGSAVSFTKQEVINRMDGNFTFCTLTSNGYGGWKYGARVRKFRTVNGTFLRTDANNTEKDNLDNLPEF